MANKKQDLLESYAIISIATCLCADIGIKL